MLFIICNVLNLSRKSVNINRNSLHNIYEALSSFWIVNCDVKLIFSVGCEGFNFLSLLPKKKKKVLFCHWIFFGPSYKMFFRTLQRKM